MTGRSGGFSVRQQQVVMMLQKRRGENKSAREERKKGRESERCNESSLDCLLKECICIHNTCEPMTNVKNAGWLQHVERMDSSIQGSQ